MEFEFISRELKPFGVEIEGIDLSQDLSSAVIDQLRRLYDKYHLLVLHDQKLTLERQWEVASLFGKLFPFEKESHYISNVRKDGYLGNNELKFHSDMAHCEYPIEGLMLHGIELDEGNTSTKFVCTVDAWTTLPEDIKRRVIDRRSVHVYSYGQDEYAVDERLSHWSHRIARPHPRTGELHLFVMPETTRIIEGMPEEEGRPLLQSLYDHIARPEAIYEHVWHVGDVVLWDNLACNHARGALNPDIPRTMQRATMGPLSFREQHPHLNPEGEAIMTAHLGGKPTG